MTAALLRSADVARLAGISKSLLWKWRREKSPEGARLRACIHKSTARSTWWSAARLRAAGIIPAEAPPGADQATPIVAATINARAIWRSA